MDYITCFCSRWFSFGGISILNKKYLLYGLGLSNSAVKQYFDLNNILYDVYLENNEMIDLDEYDIIVKSAGIKFDTFLLTQAKEKNILVISDLELMYMLNNDLQYIIVTGTNGKTTTTTLIKMLLNVEAYGNIGNPIFNKLLTNDPNNECLIEASSFMLHNTYNIKPHIYVLTSLVPHHLDYHITKENYFYDKLKLLNNQTSDDYLVVEYDLYKEYNIKTKATYYTYSTLNNNANCIISNGWIVFNSEKIIQVNQIIRKEKHNIENIMAAIIVAKIKNINTLEIKNQIQLFKGISYRLEKVIDNDSLIVFNDSKSTSIDSLRVAIEEVSLNKYNDFYKILILGGHLVDMDYSKVNNIIDNINQIYIFGKYRNSIYKLIIHNNIKLHDTLEDVIQNIVLSDKTLILFSPSQPSYDLYKNYEERGKHFESLIFYHNFCK